MEIVLATQNLAAPGGAQTYAVTLGEQLARLGHSVTMHAREIGAVAAMARERALEVAASIEDLPDEADALITGVDRGMALALAARYPGARRLFVIHGSEDIHLPPPVPGAVAATVALNDRHFARALACEGAGEVVRLRQPVDLRRFSPSGPPGEHPRRVLLLGNYHASGGGRRVQMLRDAWGDQISEWRTVGGATQTLAVAEAIAEVDIVVGYGRSILEAMACGRPAYVHDHSGSEGWVTPDSYAALEGGGFAVAGVRPPPDTATLRADLENYRPGLGSAGQDLARAHHDARDHAAQVVQLIDSLGPGRAAGERSAVRALSLLAEAQLRAELAVEHYRKESRQWFSLYNSALEQLAAERGAWDDARAESRGERAALQAAAADAEARLRAFRETRRYRLAQALATPVERVRGRRRSR